MKKTVLTIIIFFTACAMAHAQQESRHAIEITTGYRSMVTDMAFPSYDEMAEDLKSTNEHAPLPALCVGWTYGWRRRWEMSLMASATMLWYEMERYPMVQTPDGNYEVNKEGRTYMKREYCVAPAISVDFRYKWLDRRNVEMYSGIGLGVSLVFPVPHLYFAPIGIKAGGGRVYSIAELNLSPHDTGGMLGIGVRLGNGKQSQSEWRRRQAVIQ
ncbi:MAG: hypothetical protein MRZ12_02840 [Bacteroidales bacterium]|nr:hypothetical protein [Bacteroidales bacterium]